MAHWRTFIGLVAAMLVLGSCTRSQTAAFAEANEAAAQTLHNTARVLELSRLTPVELIARNAAVKVADPFGRGHGSGTYVKMHGRYGVVTAAHVVDTKTTMFIEARDEEVVVGRVVYRDFDADLAILIVPQLHSRIAAPWRPCKDSTNLLGASVTYTGFPGVHDLLTIRGHIAALERDMVVANMFGWFGSSGSGVFDQQGRYLGIVSGIDVGTMGFGVRIPLESIVWVAPVSKLDHEMVKIRIVTL